MKLRKKQPTNRIRQIGNLTENPNRKNPNRRRLYDYNGIAPCMVDFSGGGNLVPLILLEYTDPIKF